MNRHLGKLILFSLGFIAILFAANLGIMLGWVLPGAQATPTLPALLVIPSASPVLPTRLATQTPASSPPRLHPQPCRQPLPWMACASRGSSFFR